MGSQQVLRYSDVMIFPSVHCHKEVRVRIKVSKSDELVIINLINLQTPFSEAIMGLTHGSEAKVTIIVNSEVTINVFSTTSTG